MTKTHISEKLKCIPDEQYAECRAWARALYDWVCAYGQVHPLRDPELGHSDVTGSAGTEMAAIASDIQHFAAALAALPERYQEAVFTMVTRKAYAGPTQKAIEIAAEFGIALAVLKEYEKLFLCHALMKRGEYCSSFGLVDLPEINPDPFEPDAVILAQWTNPLADQDTMKQIPTIVIQRVLPWLNLHLVRKMAAETLIAIHRTTGMTEEQTAEHRRLNADIRIVEDFLSAFRAGPAGQYVADVIRYLIDNRSIHKPLAQNKDTKKLLKAVRRELVEGVCRHKYWPYHLFPKKPVKIPLDRRREAFRLLMEAVQTPIGGEKRLMAEILGEFRRTILPAGKKPTQATYRMLMNTGKFEDA